MLTLSETQLMKIKQTNKDTTSAAFEIEPLMPGYGMTIGNALRRVLLTSLPGSAPTWVKIAGTTHEFSTLPGMRENVVELMLNLKGLKVKLYGDEPAILKLKKTGPGTVCAGDFAKNASVEIADPKYHIATLDKKGKLELELNIASGRGYETVEQRTDEKLPLGTVAIDSIFSPIKKVNYEIANTRVGGMTNYDKLIIDLTTDGTIDPENAMHTATKILLEHFDIIRNCLQPAEPVKKTAKKIAPKKDAKVKKTPVKAVKKAKKVK